MHGKHPFDGSKAQIERQSGGDAAFATEIRNDVLSYTVSSSWHAWRKIPTATYMEQSPGSMPIRFLV